MSGDEARSSVWSRIGCILSDSRGLRARAAERHNTSDLFVHAGLGSRRARMDLHVPVSCEHISLRPLAMRAKPEYLAETVRPYISKSAL